MKKLFPFVILFLLLNSCIKETPNPFSFWNINDEPFSSNEVVSSETKGGSSIIESNGLFRLNFGFMYLPQKDMYIIKEPTNNPDYATLIFQYNNQTFTIMEDSIVLQFKNNNGKKQYILPTTWFQSTTSNDSVQIGAIFNKP